MSKIKPGDARILSFMKSWIPDLKAMELTRKKLEARKAAK